MTDRVEDLEREVAKLDQAEFKRFASWFAEYEAACWDAQIVEDFAEGRLNFLIEEANAERQAGTLKDI